MSTAKEHATELLKGLAAHYEAHPESWRRDGDKLPDSFCIIRGLRHRFGSTVPDPIATVLHDRIARAIKAVTGAPIYPYGIATWNDTHARDVQEVIAVLRTAATL